LSRPLQATWRGNVSVSHDAENIYGQTQDKSFLPPDLRSLHGHRPGPL